MKITEFSLRNPLVVAALTGAVIVFGFAAYLSMGIGVFPNVSFPEVESCGAGLDRRATHLDAVDTRLHSGDVHDLRRHRRVRSTSDAPSVDPAHARAGGASNPGAPPCPGSARRDEWGNPPGRADRTAFNTRTVGQHASVLRSSVTWH